MVSGTKIRNMREVANLSQIDLANAVFVSQPAINKIEVGVKEPSVALLKRMADFFGCTVDELLENTA